ncbi:MAG TPA: DUF502 domain-containing protein [Stellaceae bacterium]|nr:DUF502 domain-containing protein [Stellaceae bacterium]
MEGSSIPQPPQPRKRHRIVERLRAYFIAGILVTGPLALTVYLTWAFIHFIDQSIGGLLPPEYNPATYVRLPGLGLLIAVVGLTLVGALTAGYLGRLLVRLSERILARMPVVRGIYSAAKQIFETVLASKSNTFREVVLTEWPRQGMWTVAFVTAHPDGEIREQVGPDAIAIYVPTTPNPTSGYLMFVRRRDVVTLPMSIEEGIKLVISGGIVAPPARAPAVAHEPEIAGPRG